MIDYPPWAFVKHFDKKHHNWFGEVHVFGYAIMDYLIRVIRKEKILIDPILKICIPKNIFFWKDKLFIVELKKLKLSKEMFEICISIHENHWNWKSLFWEH